MSHGPYEGGGWCEDRPSRAEAEADRPSAAVEAQLLAQHRARVAQLSPTDRARYEASMADPWAPTERTTP